MRGPNGDRPEPGWVSQAEARRTIAEVRDAVAHWRGSARVIDLPDDEIDLLGTAFAL